MTRARTARPAADPILAAIASHRAAYDAFQVAPASDRHPKAIKAFEAYTAATDALVVTACTSSAEALALLEHLRWWTGEERDFAADYQPAYGLAQARIADLTLHFGANPLPAAVSRSAGPLGKGQAARSTALH